MCSLAQYLFNNTQHDIVTIIWTWFIVRLAKRSFCNFILSDVARCKLTRTSPFFWPAWLLIRFRYLLPFHIWYRWKAIEQVNTITNKLFLLLLDRILNEKKNSKNLEKGKSMLLPEWLSAAQLKTNSWPLTQRNFIEANLVIQD